METLSYKISDFAVRLQYENLPEPVVTEVKRYLLDSVGCAFGGYKTQDCQIALEVIEDLGGRPEATLIGNGKRTSCYYAALANGLMVRALDYNDIYWKQDPSHPSDLIPMALAVGERERKSGKDVIVAIVLAYEFEMRLCEFAIPGIRERKWHHASLTQFVSPIVAGKLLGLDAEQMTHAIGISGCHNFTLGAVAAGKLTMMKNMVDPLAAQSGVLAALLAQKGYTGTEAIFEGKEGFMDTFGGQWDTSRLTAGLGENLKILECSMKAFPTEALTHSPLTAILKLVKEHGVTAEMVESVVVKTIARAVDILADPSKYKPTSKETADHSLPYCIAAAIADGMLTTAQFTEAKLRDPRILELLPKIKAVVDPKLEKLFPALKPAEVVLRTKGGQEYACRVDYPKGDPREPMTAEELNHKFDALVAGMISEKRKKQIIEMIWNLEKVKDIGQFMKLLVAGPA